ncbi:MAG: winged helix-turn-helix transcriptional regulator [Candidatus Aenigmarchaeota archaeon]|nr:winged helix-turn-helix transcriptional regulator [Candidatus Aenigmarchaeota archaeon]
MDLNSGVLKALGSETRLVIIKHLKERRMTLTELAARLKMHASTVKEHLDIMSKAGLVEQQDEGRKWKYYSLTPGCKSLLSPYPSEIRILIPLALALFAVGFSSNGSLYSQSVAEVGKGYQPAGGALPVPDISSLFVLAASVAIIISAYLVARKLVFLEGLFRKGR